MEKMTPFDLCHTGILSAFFFFVVDPVRSNGVIFSILPPKSLHPPFAAPGTLEAK